ncbi:DUF4384 domain-containing protein, partial [Candidatus Latescibacterota bacterium]
FHTRNNRKICKYIGRHYGSIQEGLYVTGFGIGENESLSDRRSLSEQNARSDLSSKFIINVQSELQSILKESSDKEFYSDIRNSVSSQTQLKMIGVDVIHWDDTRHRLSYALAVMEIESAINNYSNNIEELTEKISNLVKTAESAEKRGDVKLALANYRKTFPLFIELGEIRTILRLLQGKSPFGSQDESRIALSVTSTEIESRINSIIHEDINSIGSGAVSLAEQLNIQVDEKLALAVFPLTYLDTDFSSEFSGYFLPVLEAELTSYFNVVSRDISGGHSLQTQHVLTGTYWVKDDMIRILEYITDLNTGSKRAAATVIIPKDIVEKEGIQLLPRNFQQAMEDRKVFLKQDVIPGTLSLEVWTSKGNKSLIFKENEETEIFVRVNKPCYLQVIYHMANGVRLLLYNNLYIDISKVNQVFTFPDTFYFAPPLGVERLQVFASTEKLNEMRTSTATYDGEMYDNVFDEDFKNHTVAMRGIKKKKTEREMAERIVTITTIP